MDNIREWLASAVEDAERRRLPQLKPLLESLARSMAALRAADWNDTVNTRIPAREERQ
jgi:hypothetical protein